MIIRKAQKTETDCGLVFTLSNDPAVRLNSFNTDRIEYSRHVQWYEKAISDNNLLFFLVFEEDDFVGQIRFNRKSDQAVECVISLSIVERFRGKGFADLFLKAGIQEMQKNWPQITSIIAEVKEKNISSNMLFLKKDFKLVSKINIYKLNLTKSSPGGGIKIEIALATSIPFTQEVA